MQRSLYGKKAHLVSVIHAVPSCV